MRRSFAWAVAGGAALLSTGCATGPSADDAAEVARSFFAALSAHDAEVACALLAPATRESFEQDAVSPCGQALLDGEAGLVLAPVTERAAEAGGPAESSVTVAGRQAQVVLGGEVTFLAASGDSWLITATGCVTRPDRPYDCLLEGS